ncbi:DMT family transporter [Algirhabdus cladophorae]|uniref:DMT family transporter n=1 Tax=Algirhabdus cladophorae TaxID=3377108 RepID=UPI003B845C6E
MNQTLLKLAPFAFLGLWSAGYGIASLALRYTDPMTLLLLRFLCVIAIMAVMFAVLRPPLPKTRADWGHLALVGLFIQTIYFGFSYYAFDIGIAVGTVALIMSFQPILVAILAPTSTGERVSRKRWMGLMLGLLGTGLVITARSTVEAPPLIGFVFCAIALAGITSGSLWEKRFGLDHHPVTSNLIGYSAGLIGLIPFIIAQDGYHVDWTWQFGAALAYLVIGNSVIAVSLLLAMIRAGDVSSVSSLLFLVPPLAALIAWLLVGETMPLWGWAGIGIAAVGVYIATRKSI